MLPPVPCWPDRAAVTFHYDNLVTLYHRDPVTGDILPLDKVPTEGLNRIVLWLDRNPLLEVSIAPGQQHIFRRIESEKSGIAQAYLVGWSQVVGSKVIQSIGYYLPPCSSMPGRIVVAGEYQKGIVERFQEPDFRQAPVICWPDSTTYSFYYQDGRRLDRINRETGEERTSERMPREGLRKVTLWHHNLPVVECHYQPGQRAIFRRRNEHRDTTSVTICPQGVPIEALIASTNWFANKKAVAEGKFNAFYLLGWQQKIENRNLQSITYFYPQNGQLPPRVVLAGKFNPNDGSYLPIPVGNDDTAIT